MFLRTIWFWARKIAFLAIVWIGLSFVSDTVHYKSRYETVLKTFLSEPVDSYDVIALGSSHMYCTLNPINLFRDFGIRSYVLSTRRQPLAVSYGYLKKALERQHPKVVILETLMLVNNQNYFRIEDGVAHDSLDPVPCSIHKLKMIEAFEHEGAPEDYIFPILKYHTRWKELNKQDFLISSWRERDFCRGFKLCCKTSPVDAVSVDYQTVAFCPIRGEYLNWVDKMHALALSHNAQLLLLASPYDVLHFKDGQTQLKMAKSLHAYAKARGIPFLDMNQRLEELGLDSKKDFFDFSHLNVYGADKATRCIGRYLADKYKLQHLTVSDAEKKAWADDIAKYDKKLRFEIEKAARKAARVCKTD